MPLDAKKTQLAKSFNMRWGKRKKEGERFFLKNGGKMLEQIITSFNGKCNPIRNFSEKELIEATNNFDRRKLMRDDQNSYMYEGTNESRSVLVKMFKKERLWPVGEYAILEMVTNELAIASNMSNHSNFLKLLGCCLETEIPILVYEFGVNLSYEIINCLPWETKLRIANEMANAFSYLHYGTSRIIIHRDIRVGHIYLNHDNIAKVSEFQMSVIIPLGKTHVDTEVCGSVFYIDPRYVEDGRLTEKSDVYSFGIVLTHILTGKWLKTSYDELRDQFGSFEEIFQHHLKNNVVKEGSIGMQVNEFEELIRKCVRYDPDARPTMQEVAQTLKSIRNMSL